MTQWFTDTYKLVRETEAAILVQDADEKEHWLPKSKIEYAPDDGVSISDDMIQVTMPVWLATEKGLC